MQTLAEIQTAAMKLPEQERTQLAEALIESVHSHDRFQGGAGTAWDEEIMRRRKALANGEEELIDGEAFLREIKASLER